MRPTEDVGQDSASSAINCAVDSGDGAGDGAAASAKFAVARPTSSRARATDANTMLHNCERQFPFLCWSHAHLADRWPVRIPTLARPAHQHSARRAVSAV